MRDNWSEAHHVHIKSVVSIGAPSSRPKRASCDDLDLDFDDEPLLRRLASARDRLLDHHAPTKAGLAWTRLRV